VGTDKKPVDRELEAETERPEIDPDDVLRVMLRTKPKPHGRPVPFRVKTGERD